MPGSVNGVGPLLLSSAYRDGCTDNTVSQRSRSDADGQVREAGAASANPSGRKWEWNPQRERGKALPAQGLGTEEIRREVEPVCGLPRKECTEITRLGSLHLKEPSQEVDNLLSHSDNKKDR